MKKNSSKEIRYTIRMDADLISHIEAYERANGLSKPDAIRQMIYEKSNNLSAELSQIKVAVNLSAIEAAETKKHVAKVTDILVSKLPTIDQNISDLNRKLDSFGKFLELILNK